MNGGRQWVSVGVCRFKVELKVEAKREKVGRAS